jgi:hypothetical protein
MATLRRCMPLILEVNVDREAPQSDDPLKRFFHRVRVSREHRNHCGRKRLHRASDKISGTSSTVQRTLFACWNLTRLSYIGSPSSTRASIPAASYAYVRINKDV